MTYERYEPGFFRLSGYDETIKRGELLGNFQE
jgi:hypothetical protein